MTRRRVELLFAEWQVKLGLQEWRLRFEHDAEEPQDDPFDAQVQSHHFYRWAVIRTTLAWRLGHSPEEAVPTVVHELLHLALRAYRSAAFEVTPRDEHAASIYESWLNEAEEQAVDRLSHAIAALAR